MWCPSYDKELIDSDSGGGDQDRNSSGDTDDGEEIIPIMINFSETKGGQLLILHLLYKVEDHP